ncbi:MAG: folate-binding protein YgfZ [Alphaproteobacteria bacterium]|nr:folate-binding protein YgfZ [Alphaproteobacteria bacterium]
MGRWCMAEGRGVLRIAGLDRVGFLQGLVSNDASKATVSRAIWAALLTPQGKYLHDFFLVESDGSLLLEGERDRLPDLLRRLKLYKLRSRVDLTDASEELAVALAWGDGATTELGLPRERGAAAPVDGAVAFVDPRLSALGARVLGPAGLLSASIAGRGLVPGTADEWDTLRVTNGVPDGSRDMEVEKAILLENGFDELGGCDWQKGCYVGQELTARTKYRGLVKKRLLPVAIEGPVPPPGTVVKLGEQEAGEMRSAAGNRGLALLRLEMLPQALAGVPFTAGAALLRPSKPDWVAA